MRRLRSTWLALFGGTLLLALSVSAALGAPPTGADAPRGQAIAAFVHELVFGTEPDVDEVVDEDEELAGEESERQVPEEFANHGECVAAAAHDGDGFEESEATTFGGWISEHARYVCWGLEVPTEEGDEEAAAGDESDELSAKEQLKADRAAARAEQKAAKAAARAERKAARGNNGH